MSVKLKMNLASLAFVAVMLASWFANFGWLRLVMTFFAVPLIHGLCFFLVNNFSVRYIKQNSGVRIATIASYATFLLPHILTPDLDDVKTYMFFGLIENPPDIAYYGLCAAGLNLAAIIIQIVFIVVCTKQNKG